MSVEPDAAAHHEDRRGSATRRGTLREESASKHRRTRSVLFSNMAMSKGTVRRRPLPIE